MPIIIKKNLIGVDKPIVCVPVIEENGDAIAYQIQKLASDGAKMIEWRADYYSDLFDDDKRKSLLLALRRNTPNTVLLVTVRSKAQGGCFEQDSASYDDILRKIADARCADIIDVELFTPQKADETVRYIQQQGENVILSHHDFEKTPCNEEMQGILSAMEKVDADILKLAVMPRDKSDVLRLLSVTEDFHRANPGIPLVTMSMGRLGIISRISGEMFGSCITFGSGKKASAPGQIPRDDLEDIVETLHKYYGE